MAVVCECGDVIVVLSESVDDGGVVGVIYRFADCEVCDNGTWRTIIDYRFRAGADGMLDGEMDGFPFLSDCVVLVCLSYLWLWRELRVVAGWRGIDKVASLAARSEMGVCGGDR